jgi:glycosyltransferase involved in cell wall biosynthesis
MQGGAVSLARLAQEIRDEPDLILASDMLNAPVFLSLTGARLASVPLALYFHENQLTYPLQPGEKRDLHFGFINYVSALRADAVFFNSAYHQTAFLDELPRLLKHFPDYSELGSVERIQLKSLVLPLGLDLARFDAFRVERQPRERWRILWNHRWEYDKDPGTFFRAIYQLADEGWDFDLALLGESFRKLPEEFLAARARLPDRIVHFGYAEDWKAYARILCTSDIVVSTALHEFFGTAIVEACYCGCLPVLPSRLAYPELLPPEAHSRCLYDDYDELLARLRRVLGRGPETRAFSLANHFASLDWQQMAPRYDQLLEHTARRSNESIDRA